MPLSTAAAPSSGGLSTASGGWFGAPSATSPAKPSPSSAAKSPKSPPALTMPTHKQDPVAAAAHWVAAVTQIDLSQVSPELYESANPDESLLYDWLKTGEVLCELIQRIQPGIITGKVAKVAAQSGSRVFGFNCMGNISLYLEACSTLGVPSYDCFRTVDLWEAKDLKQVVRNLHSLGRIAQSVPGFGGPHLGAKIATKNERQFSEAQLAEARAMPSRWTNRGNTLVIKEKLSTPTMKAKLSAVAALSGSKIGRL